MKKQQSAKIHPWLIWGRVSILALTGLVALIWISSYFVGIQRYQSTWSSVNEATSERASWLISNHGSIGIAWRSQDGVLGSPPPASEFELKTFKSSTSAWNNVHPEGFFSWHWIHYQQTKLKPMGLMRTEYGHLFTPYWMPFFVGAFLVFSLTVCINRRATIA
jgi:hypothetical protein